MEAIQKAVESKKDKLAKAGNTVVTTVERKADDKVTYFIQLAELKRQRETALEDYALADLDIWEKVKDVYLVAGANGCKINQTEIGHAMGVHQTYVTKVFKTLSDDELKKDFKGGKITIDGQQKKNYVSAIEKDLLDKAHKKLLADGMVPTPQNLAQQVKDEDGKVIVIEGIEKYLDNRKGKDLADRKKPLISAINAIMNHENKNDIDVVVYPSEGEKRLTLVNAFSEVIAENKDNGVLIGALRQVVEKVQASQMSEGDKKEKEQ